MVQTVWNSSQGNLFEMTHPETNKNVSRFAVHGDFFLVFLAPIYKIFPFPETLLIIQTFFIALTAIPLYLISNHFVKNRFFPVIIVLSFFLYPALQRTNIYEFHAVSLSPFFILSSFYCLIKKRYLYYAFFSFFALSTKEQLPLLYFLIAGYIFFFQKNIKIALLTLSISLIWFYLMFWKIIPLSRDGDQHFALKFLTDYGNSPFTIIKTIILNPKLVITDLFLLVNLKYLNQLFLPIAYLPLLSPLIVFSVPELLINLLSSYYPMKTINYQYTAVINPLFFLSMIYFFSFIFKKSKYLFYFFLFFLFSFSIYGSYLYSPLFYAKNPSKDIFKKKYNQQLNLKQLETLIPSSASLSVTNNLGAYVANRRYLYSFPAKFLKTDYVLLHLDQKYEKVKENKLKNYIYLLNRSSNHQLIYQSGLTYVYQKISKTK